jgi:SPP1 gp7 family putative phage head morphogenesis protein
MSVTPSALSRAVARYRRDVARGEARAMAAIHAAYEDARPRVLAEIDTLVATIEERGTVTRGQAMRLAQLDRLMEVIEQDLADLGRRTEPLISRAQSHAIDAAIEQTRAMAEARAPGEADAIEVARNWIDVPRDQLEHLIGSLADGSPVRDSLNQLGPGTADAMRNVLADGIVRSIPTRELGRQLAAQFNVSEARAQTIARTSIQQAARTAQLEQMAENSDILSGWQWFAALDERMCLSCAALHLREFPLTEQHFPAHASCRCCAVPVLSDYPDQDIGPTGEEWFDSLPADRQERMLPVWARDEYRAGNVRIRDFAQEQTDPRFGRSYRQGTRLQVEANAAARRGGGSTPVANAQRQTPTSSTADVVVRIDRAAFASDAEATKWRDDTFPNWGDKYTEREIDAIFDYRTSGYKPINTYLREGEDAVRSFLRAEIGDPPDSLYPPFGLNPKKAAEWDKKLAPQREQWLQDQYQEVEKRISEIKRNVGLIDGSFGKTTLPRDVTAWRGINVQQYGDIDVLPGSVVRDQGYTSTTLRTDTRDHFVGVNEGRGHTPAVVRVLIPKGSNVVSMDAAMPGYAPDGQVAFWEEEIVLPRDARYRVISVDREPGQPPTLTMEYLPDE